MLVPGTAITAFLQYNSNDPRLLCAHIAAYASVPIVGPLIIGVPIMIRGRPILLNEPEMLE